MSAVAASSRSCWAPWLRSAARAAYRRSTSPPIGSGSGSTSRPDSWSSLSSGASSMIASGLPAWCSTSRALTSAEIIGARSTSSDEEASSSSPRSRCSGSPGASKTASSGSRTVKTISTPSASSRRATNRSTSAVDGSSHWASSTRQVTAVSPASSPRSESAATPTRNGSTPRRPDRPSAPFSASWCSRGRPGITWIAGLSTWCRPANGRCDSEGTPAHRSTSPSALGRLVVEPVHQRRLPHAGFAAHHQRRTVPAPGRREQRSSARRSHRRARRACSAR